MAVTLDTLIARHKEMGDWRTVEKRKIADLENKGMLSRKLISEFDEKLAEIESVITLLGGQPIKTNAGDNHD